MSVFSQDRKRPRLDVDGPESIVEESHEAAGGGGKELAGAACR